MMFFLIPALLGAERFVPLLPRVPFVDGDLSEMTSAYVVPMPPAAAKAGLVALLATHGETLFVGVEGVPDRLTIALVFSAHQTPGARRSTSSMGRQNSTRPPFLTLGKLS
jgi:hypothetical protein